jgi:hypothetical protein
MRSSIEITTAILLVVQVTVTSKVTVTWTFKILPGSAQGGCGKWHNKYQIIDIPSKVKTRPLISHRDYKVSAG